MLTTMPDFDSPVESYHAYYNSTVGILDSGQCGYEGVTMKRLLQFLGIKGKAPKPVANASAREAILDMRLRVVQDELSSIRTDLSSRIDNVSKAIDDARKT